MVAPPICLPDCHPFLSSRWRVCSLGHLWVSDEQSSDMCYLGSNSCYLLQILYYILKISPKLCVIVLTVTNYVLLICSNFMKNKKPVYYCGEWAFAAVFASEEMPEGLGDGDRWSLGGFFPCWQRQTWMATDKNRNNDSVQHFVFRVHWFFSVVCKCVKKSVISTDKNRDTNSCARVAVL